MNKQQRAFVNPLDALIHNSDLDPPEMITALIVAIVFVIDKTAPCKQCAIDAARDGFDNIMAKARAGLVLSEHSLTCCSTILEISATPRNKPRCHWLR